MSCYDLEKCVVILLFRIYNLVEYYNMKFYQNTATSLRGSLLFPKLNVKGPSLPRRLVSSVSIPASNVAEGKPSSTKSASIMLIYTISTFSYLRPCLQNDDSLHSEINSDLSSAQRCQVCNRRGHNHVHKAPRFDEGRVEFAEFSVVILD